jgi:hypothetical protein
VEQFLSKMMSRLVTHSRQGDHRNKRMHAKALVVIMAGLASSWIVTGYLAQQHPAVTVLTSLLSGFAPLIGVCVLLIILALLFSYLICTVERTLADEDDGMSPEPHLKSKWRRVTCCLTRLLARCLSLKEHSPPAFLLSQE